MRYIGVKIVDAEPMNIGDYNKFRGWTIPENENPITEGYLVKYKDGYVSWCPKKQFEEANRPINELTFGQALEALKKGYRVARSGWNGKGMYIQWNHARDFEHSELLPFFTIKNVMNSFNTWVPSISDILAEDWGVVD